MNICIFSGRLTRDCETRYTQNGTPVSNFSLAVETGFGDYKRTEFVKCVLWKRENLAQYLTKGKPITITAEFQEKKWQDQQGQNRRTVEFVVKDLEFQQGNPAGQDQSQGQSPGQESSEDPFAFSEGSTDKTGPVVPWDADSDAPF